MRNKAWVWVAGFLLFVSGGIARGSIVSTFDTDADGWIHSPGGDALSTVVWSPTGGNPGGSLTLQDQAAGNNDYWRAPAKFLGNFSTSYGLTFSFDVKIDRAGQNFSDVDVEINGGGHTLSGFFNVTPTTDYTHVSVPLNEAPQWHTDGTGGAPPTAAQFQAVLANITVIEIRGDYLNGAEVASLDNVVLATVPEPASLTLVPLALALAIRRTRARA